MKLCIIGATGYVGSGVTRKALENGHEVRVLARTPEKLGDIQDKVEVVQGDIQDPAAIREAVRGCDAVIDTTGGQREPGQYELFQKYANNLVEAMREEGITRVISMAGYTNYIPGEKVGFRLKFLRGMFKLFAKYMLDAKDAVLEVFLENEDIEWTMTRASFVSKRKPWGKVRADDQDIPGGRIFREDLAEFMFECIQEGKWIRKAPMVASKRK